MRLRHITSVLPFVAPVFLPGLILALHFLVVLPSAHADLVVNGGFEGSKDSNNIPANWIPYGSYSPVRFDSGMPFGIAAYEGIYYAGEAISWAPALKNGGIYQQVPVNIGSIGSASCVVSVLNNGSPANRNWARVGIDPTGGTNPASVNVVWAQWSTPNHPAWASIETAQVTATAALVTVFVEQNVNGGSSANAVFIDKVTLTGTLADLAVAGTPPQISDLAIVSPGYGDTLFSYTLTDGEDADAPATLTPEYRIGRYLDLGTLPPEMGFVNPAQVSVPSATDGDGVGVGTWRVQGVSGGLFDGASARNATLLSYQGLGAANYPVTVEIKISDWERTGGEVDLSGAGLVLTNSSRSAYYMMGGFENPGPDVAVFAEASWYIDAASGGRAHDFFNFQPSLPTDGNNPIYFRLSRNANNTLSAARRQFGPGFTTIHTLNVAGTPLDLSQSLRFGIVVNDAVTVNIEYVLTTFMPATPSASGSGVTGLASTSAGVSHIFGWDSGTDLFGFAFLPNLQMRITAADDNGAGTPVLSDFFQLSLGSGVSEWRSQR